MIAPNTPISQWDEYDPIQLSIDRGWTLFQLSEELGVSYSIASKWSAKKRTPGRMARRLAWFIKHQESISI